MNNTGQKFRLKKKKKIILTLIQRLIRELKKCFHSLGIHVESKLVYKYTGLILHRGLNDILMSVINIIGIRGKRIQTIITISKHVSS